MIIQLTTRDILNKFSLKKGTSIKPTEMMMFQFSIIYYASEFLQIK